MRVPVGVTESPSRVGTKPLLIKLSRKSSGVPFEGGNFCDKYFDLMLSGQNPLLRAWWTFQSPWTKLNIMSESYGGHGGPALLVNPLSLERLFVSSTKTECNKIIRSLCGFAAKWTPGLLPQLDAISQDLQNRGFEIQTGRLCLGCEDIRRLPDSARDETLYLSTGQHNKVLNI